MILRDGGIPIHQYLKDKIFAYNFVKIYRVVVKKINLTNCYILLN